ncbi:MAG: asparagine synthase (glutamine-hydrolyzing) [Flavobacteriaceae bacterium]|nr:asparagine synthase (glutamine-hydrolyzing) [Flavobacteriaceae bacterium]|tara:strand:+ start:22631 stop:24514 length:1884 start_codon:yes stop_codon:yes gene_type:complete
MCGIIGYYGNNVEKFSAIPRLNLISHRGPDNKDYIKGENYFLGHTRLSILDTTESANQPMFSNDRSYVLIFNGEIYNHIELRKKFFPKVEFNSSGDTETLLEGLIKYGTDFISKLNGIFAFSFFNIVTGDIIISKDHFGIKPLYYHLNENEVYFSSELKAICSYKREEISIDKSALKNYVNFLWSPGEKTPFNEFKKLLPGTYLKGNINNLKNIKKHKYYTVPFNGQYLITKSEDDLMVKLENCLLKAVERQMLSDVPLGFFLSGGLDSSILVAMARKLNPEMKINCYTIRVDSTDGFTDDLFYAKKVAECLKVNLTIVDAKTDILKSFDKVIYHLDEPQADPAPTNVYNICKAARKDGIKVLIGGTSGDDILSGYRRHQALNLESTIENIPKFLRKLIKNVLLKFSGKSSFIRRFKKLSANIDKSKDERMMGYFSWIDHSTLRSLFLEPNDYNCFSYFENLNKFIPDEKSDLNKMLFWEINTFLTDHNLNYTDKLSMAVGVEVRVPFLDTELVEFSTKIPPNYKLKGNETKYLLKKIAEKYLPKEVIYRPKTGFGAPVRKWILNDMDYLINDYLSKETIINRGIFNFDKVSKLIEDNKKGIIDASYSIWSLLAIESWMRQFYDNNK